MPVMKKSLTSVVKGMKKPVKRKEPLWGGPEEEGITQSLISGYLMDRERFRLKVIEGLAPVDSFNHRLEYGNMWHVCEEHYANALDRTDHGGEILWKRGLREYCEQLCKKYPLNQEQVDHWYNVCKVQFPLYVEHWKSHKEEKNRTPLMQEEVFCIPYTLPSGRIVKMKGKFDSVDSFKKVLKGIYLKENKTKGEINPKQLQRQLTFDLQTMFYLVALSGHDEIDQDAIKGVRYNVIRRPLSGGKGTIVRHKPGKSNPRGESKESFYNRVGEYIINEPEHYFMRWTVDVLPADYKRFTNQFLDPCFEEICNWYDHVSICFRAGLDPFTTKYNGHRSTEEGEGMSWFTHYRIPYGCYNPLAEGVVTELDEFLISGSELGLTRETVLFPELQ